MPFTSYMEVLGQAGQLGVVKINNYRVRVQQKWWKLPRRIPHARENPLHDPFIRGAAIGADGSPWPGLSVSEGPEPRRRGTWLAWVGWHHWRPEPSGHSVGEE